MAKATQTTTPPVEPETTVTLVLNGPEAGYLLDLLYRGVAGHIVGRGPLNDVYLALRDADVRRYEAAGKEDGDAGSYRGMTWLMYEPAGGPRIHQAGY